jgi:hypothetical protein
MTRAGFLLLEASAQQKISEKTKRMEENEKWLIIIRTRKMHLL